MVESNDWIEWGGGPRPVPMDVDVEVELSNGLVLPGEADDFRWSRGHNAEQQEFDIVAYRVIRPD